MKKAGKVLLGWVSLSLVVALTAGTGMAMFFANITYPDHVLQHSDSPKTFDAFGHAVAISGDSIVVGVPGDDTGGTDDGSAYVFEHNGGAWSETRLANPDPAAADQFGNAVAIDGGTVVVGAFADGAGLDNFGAAYVFELVSGVWEFQRKLTVAGLSSTARLGWKVAISGDRIAVGAIGAARVFIFERDAGGSGGWSDAPTKSIATPSNGTMSVFGEDISMSGDLLLVGARGNGAAYLYDGGINFSLVKTITGPTSEAFALSVAISGDTAIVSAVGADTGSTLNHGAAYVFQRDQGGAGNWGQVAKLVASEVPNAGTAEDQFGVSVAISGDTAVFGAFADDIYGRESGSAYVFMRDGTGDWVETNKLIQNDSGFGAGVEFHRFGTSVGATPSRAVVGAPMNRIASSPPLPGHAYVYELEGGGGGGGSTVPEVPTLVSPAGEIMDSTPAYTWNEVTGADQYQLHVIQDGVGTVYSALHQAADICSGGSCAVDSPAELAGGDHVWRVRAFNSVGSGEWSPFTSFSVALIPIAPTLIGPSGGIANETPTYSWDQVGGATRYQLYVVQAGVGAVHSALHQGVDICSGGTCAVGTPPVATLAAGDHVWRVRALSSVGTGEWSPFMSFSVPVLLPAAPTPTGPSGSISGAFPTYSWEEVSGATRYQLHLIWSGVGSVYTDAHDASGICAAGTCSILSPPAPALAGGGHVWRVRGRNSAGSGPWSDFMSFSVDDVVPAVAVLIDPSGSIASTMPSYSWNLAAGAASYQLHVIEVGVATIHSTVYSAPSICGITTCTVNSPPVVTLVSGRSYVWRVRGFNNGARGDWSAFQSLSVQ